MKPRPFLPAPTPLPAHGVVAVYGGRSPSAAFRYRTQGRYAPWPPGPPTPTQGSAAHREDQTGGSGSWESHGLLFAAGCALAFVAACAVRVERFVAHWNTFEDFVRALVA
jgi:hypothetical protein